MKIVRRSAKAPCEVALKKGPDRRRGSGTEDRTMKRNARVGGSRSRPLPHRWTAPGGRGRVSAKGVDCGGGKRGQGAGPRPSSLSLFLLLATILLGLLATLLSLPTLLIPVTVLLALLVLLALHALKVLLILLAFMRFALFGFIRHFAIPRAVKTLEVRFGNTFAPTHNAGRRQLVPVAPHFLPRVPPFSGRNSPASWAARPGRPGGLWFRRRARGER